MTEYTRYDILETDSETQLTQKKEKNQMQMYLTVGMMMFIVTVSMVYVITKLDSDDKNHSSVLTNLRILCARLSAIFICGMLCPVMGMTYDIVMVTLSFVAVFSALMTSIPLIVIIRARA